MKQNRFVTLAQPVPQGQLLASHFSVRDSDIPSIGDGELLLRPIVFSVDPAMRGEITGWDMVGGAHHQPGDRITGPGVGEVVQSRRAGYSAGDVVRASMDWADYSVWRPDGDWCDDGRYGRRSSAPTDNPVSRRAVLRRGRGGIENAGGPLEAGHHPAPFPAAGVAAFRAAPRDSRRHPEDAHPATACLRSRRHRRPNRVRPDATQGRISPDRTGNRAGPSILQPAGVGGPGRTLGGGSTIQRGQLKPRTLTLRINHFPDPPAATIQLKNTAVIDTERRRLQTARDSTCFGPDRGLRQALRRADGRDRAATPSALAL
jgi:N-terminal domain of oxidoreductase